MKYICWKKKPSNSGLLYLILDQEVIQEANRDIFSFADRSAYYGTDIFQLRAKKISDKNFLNLAEKLAKIIHKGKKLFIVNDRVDIAYLSNADGLHIGKKDILAKAARKILGKNIIIGKTAHLLKELQVFNKEKINYLSLGPVFKTKTKPKLRPLSDRELKSAVKTASKLLFAIGGINLYNIKSLLNKGINNVAVCRDITFSKNLKATIGEYKECLRRAS